MDRFAVRVLPIAMNLYLIISTLCAMNGIDVSIGDYWLSCSITCGILLTILAHSQGKYHCKWVRLLCYNLIFVPVVSFLDALWPLFYSSEDFVFALCIEMFVVIIVAIALALYHFIKVRRIIKRQKYAQIKPLECGCPRKDK